MTFGGLLGLILLGFSFDLATKISFGGRNKVVRLGLFWVDCEFKHVDLKFINQSRPSFLFPFSPSISCLLLFLLFNLIDLDYI